MESGCFKLYHGQSEPDLPESWCSALWCAGFWSPASCWCLPALRASPPAPGEVATCSVAHLSSPLSPLSVALTLWTLRHFFTRVLEKFWGESKIHVFSCHVSVIFLNLSVLTVGTGSSMETTFADGSEIQVCN